MAEQDMNKFMELLQSGDHEALVVFAKTLKNCPHCGEEWEIKNNNLKCNGCGLSILNIDPPNPLRGSKEVW
jgi:Zn finger protein HypA/HybF involved in hydrogenase expression